MCMEAQFYGPKTVFSHNTIVIIMCSLRNHSCRRCRLSFNGTSQYLFLLYVCLSLEISVHCLLFRPYNSTAFYIIIFSPVHQLTPWAAIFPTFQLTVEILKSCLKIYELFVKPNNVVSVVCILSASPLGPMFYTIKQCM